MRVLVLILAALAGIKIWASNQMYRAAAEDAVVVAYRERAIAACQKGASLEKTGSADTDAHGAAAAWTKPASIRMVIGKRGVEVNVWDVDNAQWKARFKQAFLVLTPAEGTLRATCEYDVSANQAAIVPL